MPNAGKTRFTAGDCKDLKKDALFACIKDPERFALVRAVIPEMNKFYINPTEIQPVITAISTLKPSQEQAVLINEAVDDITHSITSEQLELVITKLIEKNLDETTVLTLFDKGINWINKNAASKNMHASNSKNNSLPLVLPAVPPSVSTPSTTPAANQLPSFSQAVSNLSISPNFETVKTCKITAANISKFKSILKELYERAEHKIITIRDGVSQSNNYSPKTKEKYDDKKINLSQWILFNATSPDNNSDLTFRSAQGKITLNTNLFMKYLCTFHDIYGKGQAIETFLQMIKEKEQKVGKINFTYFDLFFKHLCLWIIHAEIDDIDYKLRTSDKIVQLSSACFGQANYVQFAMEGQLMTLLDEQENQLRNVDGVVPTNGGSRKKRMSKKQRKSKSRKSSKSRKQRRTTRKY